MNSTASLITRPLNAAVNLRYMATTRFKTARLSLVTVRPAHETESQLATLLYGIMRRGSEHYPRLALFNRRLDELYGTTLTIQNYLHGDHHIISFTAEMPEDIFLPARDRDAGILDGVMELFSELLLRPLLDADGLLRREAVEAEKQALCDSLRAIANDTRTYAADRFRRIMCEGEPYGLSIGGTVEGIAGITPADVTAHWRRHLAAMNAELFYIGRAPIETVFSLWEKHFGAWKPSRLIPPPTRPHLPPAAPRSVEEEWPVGQGKLCMSWACGENEATLHDLGAESAMMVCNELFGVMQSSLLFRHVREELGLCYYCESALDMTKGILWVASGIRPDRRGEAEAAIRSVFQALQNCDFAPTEVEAAKQSLINGYRQMEDSQGAMEAFATRQLHHPAASGRSVEALIAATRAVTAEDVARAAQRFVPDTVYFLKGTAEAGGEEEEDDET